MMNEKKLKSLIVQKCFTIRELSNILNISEQTLTNWCNGRNISSIRTFLSLLILLGLVDEKYKDLV